MKKTLILLAVLASMSFALIDVHFGTVQCDTLQVDSLSTIAAGGFTSLTVDTLQVDSIATLAVTSVTADETYPLAVEGGSSGASWLSVDNDHATAEVGLAIFRQNTLYWTVEDSNGTFIIYDADDTQNAIMISDSTCNVAFYGNLSSSGTIDTVVVGTDSLRFQGGLYLDTL